MLWKLATSVTLIRNTHFLGLQHRSKLPLHDFTYDLGDLGLRPSPSAPLDLTPDLGSTSDHIIIIMSDANEAREQVTTEEQANGQPEIITSTSNEPIELLSDDDNGPIAPTTDPPAPLEEPSTTMNSDEAREIVPSPEVLHQRLQEQALAQQKKLADRFRNRAPQPPSTTASVAPATPAASVIQPDDDDVGARYEAAKKEYYRKKRSNALDIQDEIAFMRIEGEYSAYQRKAAADARFDESDDDESGLFVTDRETVPAPLSPRQWC